MPDQSVLFGRRGWRTRRRAKAESLIKRREKAGRKDVRGKGNRLFSGCAGGQEGQLMGN